MNFFHNLKACSLEHCFHYSKYSKYCTLTISLLALTLITFANSLEPYLDHSDSVP